LKLEGSQELAEFVGLEVGEFRAIAKLVGLGPGRDRGVDYSGVGGNIYGEVNIGILK
jgi:hypothetical protein